MPVHNNIFTIDAGMPREIWIDKYSRKKDDGDYQSFQERITDVVQGNFLLDPRQKIQITEGKFDINTITYPNVKQDYEDTLKYAEKGIIAMSGRHLQHGDLDQKEKTGELFTNCASATFSFIKFYLLLKGSGVGRSYDSDACWTDWDYMPNARFVLSTSHPNYEDWVESLEEAQHKYDSESEDVRWFEVEDSAEGWVKVVAILETAAFHKNNRDNLFVFNVTPVRRDGLPIKGQQGRPSSGPIPLIKALLKVMSVKGAGFKPWKQALFIDHYMSECVRLGGVRRSARLAMKYWKDKDAIDFIDVKRGGWLHTANNSIAVDEEFWEQALSPKPSHARRVFEAAVSAAYFDNTGEPGFINVDKLTWDRKDAENIDVKTYINKEYEALFGGIHYKTKEMMDYVLTKVSKKKYAFLCNPCVEIVFSILGAYCIVGDACISNADSEEEAIAGVTAMGRMLVRTNLMKYLYKQEVDRTNRIGISLIGIHEFAAKFYNYNFHDLIDEEKSEKFWSFIKRMAQEVTDGVNAYCDEIGVNRPATVLTLKPAGTVAKVMGVSEAANLPPMPYYLRFIQFKAGHPLLTEYQERGYPVYDISKSVIRVDEKGKEYPVNGYADTFIVGFPTKPLLTDMLTTDEGDDRRMVCAEDITVDEHYKWLQLLEKNWLGGPGLNNQVSYTLKYDPKKVSYAEFMKIVLEYQPTVRCCAVMPETDFSAFIYTPEQRISKQEYDDFMAKIDPVEREAIDEGSLDCASGACGIDFSRNASVAQEAELKAQDEMLAQLQAAE
jgi:adenosylcobalamin-dependent ribonucleoside-triphosphate reductase